MAFPTSSADESRQKILTQLQQLRTSAGWRLLTASLKELLAATEKGIFQLGGNEVKYSEKDVLNMRRELLLDFITKPEKLIADIMPQKDIPPEEFDPFS